MARINNSDTIKRILNDAGIQTSHDDVPQQLASKVVPVLISNPEKICDVVERNIANNVASVTVYTTPTDKDFYLNSAALSLIKDASATSTNTKIIVIVNGVSQEVLDFGTITLTAENRETTISYPAPLKLDRGSAILLTNSTAVANIRAVGCITGFTKDPL